MLKQVALTLAMLLADERQDLLKALHDAELKLELAKRAVPAEFDLATDTLGYDGKEVGRERVASFELHRVEISGPREKLDEFLLRMATRDFRAGELEALNADAKQFTARVVLPVFVGSKFTSDLRAMLTSLQAAQETLDRMHWSRMRDAYALLDAVEKEVTTVQVTGMRVDGDATVEGVFVGAAAWRRVVDNIEQTGLGVARVRMSPSGACRAFAITTSRAKVERQSAFDLETPPLCRADPEPHVGVIAARGTGDLSLHFKNIDLTDLFFVLHNVTSENFVVDADVKGAVDVDVEKASVDDVLAAIRKLKLVLSDGPLRRVSRAGARSVKPDKYEGEPVSITVSDAELHDLLCLFHSISGLEFIVPADLRSKANVQVSERPWDEVLATLIAAANLGYTIDGTRVLVGEKATVNACEAASRGASAFPIFLPKLEDLAAADLTLAGVAGTKAFAYGPGDACWCSRRTLAYSTAR